MEKIMMSSLTRWHLLPEVYQEMKCELDVNIGLYLRAAADYLWVQMQYIWFGSATFPKVQSTTSLDFQKEKLETIDASHQDWLFPVTLLQTTTSFSDKKG